MADYSSVLPESDREAQALLSSCGPAGDGKPYDVASLVLDEGVRLSFRTVYGGDGTPMDEWHGLVRRYALPGGIDVAWLRAGLAEGGELAELIGRILAGHSTAWDGRNTVGRLNEDGQEAEDALSWMLIDPPLSALEVWDAESWLWSGALDAQSLAALLREETPEGALSQAESDGTLVIRGGVDAMREAFEAVFATEAEDAA